ncbi:hypothetical protein QMZ92_09355 [Streptomyces sp. HNM0645]|uniref:hypothetical protein n=1 Tax=Streptomyces sp. HNM0645 TaxID=2782343 RepID=UPI0024B8674F|nr:hypothetical protein [Streptomyces sp. HNM0645]MDI9884599.1 hypothetical protein [Streptomyces sp. HNM0645]
MSWFDEAGFGGAKWPGGWTVDIQELKTGRNPFAKALRDFLASAPTTDLKKAVEAACDAYLESLADPKVSAEETYLTFRKIAKVAGASKASAHELARSAMPGGPIVSDFSVSGLRYTLEYIDAKRLWEIQHSDLLPWPYEASAKKPDYASRQHTTKDMVKRTRKAGQEEVKEAVRKASEAAKKQLGKQDVAEKTIRTAKEAATFYDLSTHVGDHVRVTDRALSQIPKQIAADVRDKGETYRGKIVRVVVNLRENASLYDNSGSPVSIDSKDVTSELNALDDKLVFSYVNLIFPPEIVVDGLTVETGVVNLMAESSNGKRTFNWLKY